MMKTCSNIFCLPPNRERRMMTTLKTMRMIKMMMMKMAMRMMESETLIWVVKSLPFAGLGRHSVKWFTVVG